ncbi:MAG: hypothetical protein NXH88_11735 [Hyphomonas sp.]|nr:hypothetical protein [Hyphomonas sp.]
MTPIAHNRDHFLDAHAAQMPSNALSQLGMRHRGATCVRAGWAADAVGQHLERKIKGCEPNGSIALLLLMFLGAVEFAAVPQQRLRH